jgi:HSP20 family protein
MVVTVQRYPVVRPVFGGIFNAERQIGSLFNSLLGTGGISRARTFPAIDLAEYENESILVAEMPGVKKEDVKISLENRFLTISGERKAQALPEGASLVRNEVDAGEFSRSIELSHALDADKITAEMENGILRVVLPKPEASRPREIRLH